ncbi:MAG: CT_584 family protein [Chlamydiales bacterium]
MPEQQKNKLVLDDRMILLFEGNMKRIFAMKITRSTFRELQNVILNCADQNQEIANFLFETLLTGQINASVPNEKHREILEEVIKNFTIPARLSQEVYKRGEYINIITSDLISNQEELSFLNRLRRIDGEEFVFMSDSQNTINLLQHFVGRLLELEKAPKGNEELKKFKKELNILGERLKQLAM